MKVDLVISAMSTNGETCEVRASGRSKKDAEWRQDQTWRFEVPDHVGRSYRLGQKLRVTVTPE